MPNPYQLKLNAQRLQNILKRLWEQKRFFQEQHTLRADRQHQEFNEKMLRLSRTSRPSFRKPILDEQNTNYFRLGRSRKAPQVAPEKARVMKPHSRTKSKTTPSHTFMQRAYFHVLGFFARDTSLQQKRAQEKLILKQIQERKIAEQERINRLEL